MNAIKNTAISNINNDKYLEEGTKNQNGSSPKSICIQSTKESPKKEA